LLWWFCAVAGRILVANSRGVKRTAFLSLLICG
jgi:hypothetical protein